MLAAVTNASIRSRCLLRITSDEPGSKLSHPTTTLEPIPPRKTTSIERDLTVVFSTASATGTSEASELLVEDT
jgi:hypothetical protein